MRVQGSWLEVRSISEKTGRRFRFASSRFCSAWRTHWSGIGREAELRAAIPEVVALQDLRVVVEGVAVRPGAVGRRHVGDRPPPGAPERGGERETFAPGQRGIAPGAVDPDSRLERGVGEPAASAVRRGGEPTAPGREAVGRELLVAGFDELGDGRRERRSLDGHLPVALDEHEQDVLAAQSLEEPAGRRVAVRILAGDQASELSLAAEVGLYGAAPRRRRGARRSSTRPLRRRPVRLTPSRSPRRRRARPPAAASLGGSGPRPESAGPRPTPGRRVPRDRSPWQPRPRDRRPGCRRCRAPSRRRPTGSSSPRPG